MVFGILKIKKFEKMEKYSFLGRPMLLIKEKDIKKIIKDNWCNKLTSLLKGGSSSKLRRFICRVTGLFLFWKWKFQRLIGKNFIPTFEIATNPTIKISDIKEHRFKIEK